MQQLVTKPQTVSSRPAGVCPQTSFYHQLARRLALPSHHRLQQQHQQRQCVRLQATPKPGLSADFLTEKPIGKLLSGLVGTPVFVGMELVALLVMLGLTDAGYSGDWSRIGAITKDQELLLQQLAVVAWSLHGVCGLITAKIASSKGRNPAVSFVKGVLFGSLHVFEELVLPPVDGQPLRGAAADTPARRR